MANKPAQLTPAFFASLEATPTTLLVIKEVVKELAANGGQITASDKLLLRDLSETIDLIREANVRRDHAEDVGQWMTIVRLRESLVASKRAILDKLLLTRSKQAATTQPMSAAERKTIEQSGANWEGVL